MPSDPPDPPNLAFDFSPRKPPAPPPPQEPRALTVAELDRAIKGTLEESFVNGVWVEGEVADLRAAPSGHLYFCLKDEKEEASIDVVVYRSNVTPRMKNLCVQGARARLRGRPTFWAPRGRLQLVADRMQAAGRGALLEALEQLKAKLAAEGLFAQERKRPLPKEPRVVGVVTSPTGAVIHDVCRVAFRRGGARILLSPALLERLSALELQQVVLHEMEHLHRGDDWSNLIQKIGLTLFPLNPVLYWTEGRLCEERELACDDRVLKSSCTRKSYAMCLTRLAEDSVLRRKLSLALGAWERRSELVSRVQRLLVRPGQSMGSRQAKMVTAGLILAISGGSLALTRSPQLVGFTTMGPSAVHATAVLGTDLHPQGLRGSNVANATGSLQLVKAVMPQSAVQETLKPKLVHAHVVKHAVKPRIARDRQAWLVLTEWNDSLPPAHLVIAVAPGDGNRYAAVPIAHGWLILQI